MKKIFLVALSFAPLALLAPHVFAQTSNFIPLVPNGIPGLTDTQTVHGDASLANFFNNLYKYLIGASAAIAIIIIIWEGIRIATNQDNVSVLTDGKNRIYQAILGLVLVLSPVLVFSIINPGILNLSIGLKPIDLTTSPSNPQGPPSGFVKPPDDAAIISCKAAGTLGVLQDCTAAKNQCIFMVGPEQTIVTNDVVCMKDGFIDSTVHPSADPATTCNPGETKYVECIIK